MKCPKCGTESDNSQCRNCGFDFDIYTSTKLISAKLYNKGLEQANNKNFSSAIELLNKSVKFDKGNYKARNVLGLVYLEIGEISKALKEWVISNSLVKENNLAKEYIESIQNNTHKLEKYNNAIKMYNQALVYANQKSEDMAIIQLKKSLDLNPNFVDSYNLLALCYMNVSETEKALSCIEKALEIDMTNTKALKYYIDLKQSSQRSLKIDKNTKTSAGAKYSSPQPKTKANIGNRAFGHISGFIIGAVTIAIVMYILVMPATKSGLQTQITQLTEKNQSIEKQLEDTIKEDKATIAKLEENNKAIEDNNATLNLQLQEKEQIQKVQQISVLYNEQKVEEATQLLLSLSPENFPEETKTLYNSLKEKLLPAAAKIYYDNALALYNKKNYNEARGVFDTSFSMSNTESFSDDTLYYIAMIEEINGNIENAKKFYQRVVDEYPKSNQLWNSKNKLTRLK